MASMISLFDYSTVMAQSWARAGVKCYCVDIQHVGGVFEVEPNIYTVCANILDYKLPDDEIIFLAAFPPCTHLAISGAKHFKDKGLGKLIEALTLFKRAVDLAIEANCPYMIENPVSTVSTYWRPPDYMFDPCDYGDPYTKKTCLWTGNGFVMPPTNYIQPTEGSKMHLIPPSKDRANIRSQTSIGFAEAVFESNYKEL